MIICPSCGKKFSGHDDLHGKKVACPKCQKHFIADIAARPETQPTEHEKTPPTSKSLNQITNNLNFGVVAVLIVLFMALCISGGGKMPSVAPALVFCWIAGAIVFAIFGNYVAREVGRPPNEGIVLGALLGPIGIILIKKGRKVDLLLKLHKRLKPQDYVLAVGLFLFILAGLFPPWLFKDKSASISKGSHWLWARARPNVHIDTVNLLVEWFVIGVVTAVVYFIVWNRLQPAKPPPHVDD